MKSMDTLAAIMPHITINPNNFNNGISTLIMLIGSIAGDNLARVANQELYTVSTA